MKRSTWLLAICFLIVAVGCAGAEIKISTDANAKFAAKPKPPEKTKQALLVIDVQNEYFSGKLPVTYPRGTLDNIIKAMDSAARAWIPVIVVQHSNLQPDSETFLKDSDGWQLHPEIAKRNRDILIEKSLPGSFTGTDLQSWLKSHGVNTLVIAGYMSHMCCDTTARQAFLQGYKVTFLSDATGTLAQKNEAGLVTADSLHKTVLVVQSSRFSKVMSTDAWIKTLVLPK